MQQNLRILLDLLMGTTLTTSTTCILLFWVESPDVADVDVDWYLKPITNIHNIKHFELHVHVHVILINGNQHISIH